ncbi:MAG: holin [Anaerovoracaceae bacterium]
MNKWKNYGLWTSLFSLFGLILCNTGQIDAGQYQTIVSSILSVLTALGIISNPSSGCGFTDKEGKE